MDKISGEERFSRTGQLIGSEALEKLNNCRIAVFGAGGVGGYAIEALARSGVGGIDIIDGDKVNITNINRQIIALSSTVGQYKTHVFKERIALINPECKVTEHTLFYLPDTEFDFSVYDYVVDAVDTVAAKIAVVENCKKLNVPVISAMGAGNKLNPAAFKVGDIYNTSVCPLARVMRHELKKRGIDSLKVVWSDEEPLLSNGERTPASCAFVPSVAGLLIASEVIKDLTGLKR